MILWCIYLDVKYKYLGMGYIHSIQCVNNNIGILRHRISCMLQAFLQEEIVSSITFFFTISLLAPYHHHFMLHIWFSQKQSRRSINDVLFTKYKQVETCVESAQLRVGKTYNSSEGWFIAHDSWFVSGLICYLWIIISSILQVLVGQHQTHLVTMCRQMGWLYPKEKGQTQM